MRCASFSGAWKRNANSLLFALAACFCVAPAILPATFDIPSKPFLIDEVVPIFVTGLAPSSTITLQLRGPDSEASIDYRADANGIVDLAKGDDPRELFWSAGKPSHREPADRWDLTAVAGGKTVATTSVVRRAVAADVKVSPVHERGLVGELYEIGRANV